MIFYNFIKRLLDIIFSFILIIILAPLLLTVLIFVKILIGGTPVFKQKRVGQYNRIFTIYKFRTIKENMNGNGILERDDFSTNKFGRFLRHTSIDELPQLFNILKGDMSFVGPRPKTIFENMLMEGTIYRYRNIIRPGLTSWSIIHGRNDLPNNTALFYDIEHVAMHGFLNDLIIFMKTFPLVIKRTGVNKSGMSTFIHLSDFLLEKKLITPNEVAEKKEKSQVLENSKIKIMPDNLSKIDFKLINEKIRKNKKTLSKKNNDTWLTLEQCDFLNN